MTREEEQYRENDVLALEKPTEGKCVVITIVCAVSRNTSTHRHPLRRDTPPARHSRTHTRTHIYAGFLCPLSANTYGIHFLHFLVRDGDADPPRVLFEVATGEQSIDAVNAMLDSLSLEEREEAEKQIRVVNYSFPKSVLESKTIRTMLEFKVGDQPVKDFRMIERHYVQGSLLRSYDFTVPFCIPGSTNTWEAIYDVPETSQTTKDVMLAQPGAHVSDSFYFIEGKMVMHLKAVYTYTN